MNGKLIHNPLAPSSLPNFQNLGPIISGVSNLLLFHPPPNTPNAVMRQAEERGTFTAPKKACLRVTTTLDTLLPGQRASIARYDDVRAGQMLMSMGLLPGDAVLLERVAPFGGPMAFRSGSLLICMRPEEAASVQCVLTPVEC